MPQFSPALVGDTKYAWAQPGRWRLASEAGLLFVAAGAAFFILLSRCAGLLDIDALYHFKLARLIREHGPWVDISWLPLTVLGERGPDHHWLFHVLLAPLTLLGQDRLALDLSAAIVGALVLVGVYVILRRARVPLAIGFALLTMVSASVLPFRFLTLRAQSLALLLTLMVLFALTARRWCLVGIAAFLFMQSYHGAVILTALPLVVVAAARMRREPLPWQGLIAVPLGVALALLASPWYPQNIDYLVFHTFFKAALGERGLAGSEWMHLGVLDILREAWPAHSLLASGIALWAGWGRARRPSVETLAAMMMSAVFLLMYSFAWRFGEYYAPWTVISAALLWRDGLAGRQLPPRLATALALVLAVLIAAGAWRGAQRMLAARASSYTAFAEIMHTIDAVDPAPLVFNSHWPNFVQMFYWSSQARYVAGLDGHYLLYGSPAKANIWRDIVSGHTLRRNDNGRVIRDTFGAGWVVLPRGHGPLAAVLKTDQDASLVLENDDGWLFRLRPGSKP